MKDIQIKTEYVKFEEDKSYLVKTDQKRLQQVLLNLVSNAIKFTNKKGKIIMQVELQSNHLKLSVMDNGIGIKKKDH